MHHGRGVAVEAVLALVLQGALVGMLVFGAERFPRGQWNERPLSLAQSKFIQGFLALCVVFHHCAQKVVFERWRTGFSFSGLEVMALLGFAFVGYFFLCSGYGLYQSCQRRPDYLDNLLARRVVPLLAIYYICNTAYLVGRLAMGETFGALQLVCLVCGLGLANPNSWFVVSLPLMYLLFYAARKSCADEALVTRRLFLGTGLYILVGMVATTLLSGAVRYGIFLGRWWYNTAILFPLGYLLGQREREAWEWMRRSYRTQVACAAVLFVGSFVLSLLVGTLSFLVPIVGVLGPLRPVVELALESLSTIGLAWGLLLYSLRRRVTSRLLGFYGGLTLELYLTHGFFANLFFQPFYDKGEGVLAIGSPALFILAVIACGTAVALLFRQLTKRLLKSRAVSHR